MEYFPEYKAVAILLKTIPLILVPKVSGLNTQAFLPHSEKGGGMSQTPEAFVYFTAALLSNY